ncbi:ATP-grasp domain-containing protein [Bradyrhizobium jicamae]|uniref:ATP-grasp domain-containing protein n=1 Tax=Bradyrhizobium jicamae TaxID=280332 RepID=A0ABS5FWI2_9BRAD|nr:ATP-grasp domain-containing protein [Bradyrhizobium jicamae]MBR0801185.1 ATP-grasp domain-containing protein [Bradyrhizobium jicamae]
MADRFVHQNFSDVVATAAALARLEFDGIIPLNDFAIHSAARIARDRTLPGWNEFAERCFISKVAMKRCWIESGLPTPRCTFTTVAKLLAGEFPDWDIWPAVIKPAFSGGGSRGVFIARDWDEAAAGLRQVERTYLDGEIVIEEFIKGSEHTLEVLVCRGNPTLLSISDKENYAGSDTVVQKLFFPGPVGHSYRKKLEPLVFAACRSMQLTDGTAHFEVLIRNGELFLLEVGGRPGGGLNLQPICEISTGYDYPALLATVLSGGSPDFERKRAEHLAWHYFPRGDGILRAVEGFASIKDEPDVVDAELYEEIGKPRFDLRNDLARPGYVLVRSSSIERARERAAKLVAGVRFVTTEAVGSSS